MDVPADLVMNTADTPAEDTPTEDAQEATQETPQAAEKAGKAEEPKEASAEPEKTSPEPDNGGLLATLKEALALKDEVKALKEELAAVTKRAEEAEAYRLENRKLEALRKAGLPEQCARFLGESDGDWEGAIADLVALRGTQTTPVKGIPEDGEPGTVEPRTEDGTPLSEACRMLGI